LISNIQTNQSLYNLLLVRTGTLRKDVIICGLEKLEWRAGTDFGLGVSGPKI
jgi:hypothetical protein